eukprot:g9507.t1
MSGRDALRGAEVDMLDLMFEELASEELAAMLKAPLLERAVAKHKRDLSQRLVRAGAEIGEALHKALLVGNDEIVNDLLESGASLAAVDAEGRTPLHLAILRDKAEIVQLLLAKGADIDAFDSHAITPLYLATDCGHLEAAVSLLAAGADVNLGCERYKSPVIHNAVGRGHVEILRAMIEHGADVNAVNTKQCTALHCAVVSSNPEVCDVLIEAGANVEARDNRGATPLHFAAIRPSLEASIRLLKHGANINAQYGEMLTPLVLAASVAGAQGAAEVVECLLRADVDETIADDERYMAVGLIGKFVKEEDRLGEDVERVRKLLVNAPADRAWRRRGYLVLCRAHPDRVQQRRVIGGTHHTNVARRTRSRTRLARGSTGDSSLVNEGNGGDWTAVVSKVTSMQEEEAFRIIVGYL